MNKLVSMGALAAIVLSAGCATTARCPEPGAYADARPAEPYGVPEDMERPDTAARVRIPRGAESVPAGLRGNRWEAADGTLRCLDQPPPMREDVQPTADFE